MSPQQIVPHLWHMLLVNGLSVSILVRSQRGEVPDAIVWQSTEDARNAITMADDPQFMFLKAEYREDNIERLARRLVLAALAEMMHVAQIVSSTMDRLAVEHRSTTSQHAIARPPSLGDLFAQVDEKIEQVNARRLVENQPTIAYADLPTVSVNRITGDDVTIRQAPPPPDWRL